MQPPEKTRAYARNIVYCTSKTVVFDYLRDRLAIGDNFKPAAAAFTRVGRDSVPVLLQGLQYAIVDEADSIFIDEDKITFWTNEEDQDNHLQSKAKLTIDCNKRKFRFNEELKYDDKGSVTSKASSEDYEQWVEIPPGSIIDTAGELLCDEDNKPRTNYKNALISWGNFVNQKRKEINEK